MFFLFEVGFAGMEFKNLSHDVKDVDDAKGIVTAYANVYHNEDSDGDISEPGSFTKTVSENKKRIRCLKDHISTITLGVPLELDAKDPYGLGTVTQFNMKKEVARDMFEDIKLALANDLNAELSFGYEIVERQKNDKRRIKEYKLYEYSFLSAWAANELAISTGIKNLHSQDKIIKQISLLTEMYNRSYSDGRLLTIENALKSLANEPGIDTTLIEEPIKLKSIFDLLSN